MAIRTDQLTLLDLSEDRLLARASQIADFVQFLRTGKVIPFHSGVVKSPAAISAGRALLQLVVPAHNLKPSLPFASRKARLSDAVVGGIVRPPAALAPTLTSGPTPVESV